MYGWYWTDTVRLLKSGRLPAFSGFLRPLYPGPDRFASHAIGGVYVEYARGDLNPQPSAPEADALSS